MRVAILAMLLAVSLAGMVLAMTSTVVNGGDALWPLSWAAWAPMGFLILMRRPRNGVGRALMFIGVTMGLSLAALALTASDLSLQARVWAETINLIFGVLPWLGIVWVVFVFPSGGFDGSGERRSGRLLIAYGAIAAAAFAIDPTPMEQTGVPGPLSIPALREMAAFITSEGGFMGIPVLMLAAIFLLVRRWRRSQGVERAQFRWLFLGATTFVLVVLMSQWLPDASNGYLLWLPAGFAIPTTIGVAVTRYRLYEIDRVVSRTVSYAVLVALLGLLVAGAATIVGAQISERPVFVAMSTLTVAALFNPLRRRIQSLVDRRFNRSRFDAERVMAEFATSLRNQVEPVRVVEGWVGVVSETMQPSASSVWVKGES